MTTYAMQKGESAATYWDRLVSEGLAERQQLAVRIGRGGRKFHPATVLVLTNGRRMLCTIDCACQGVANGHARHKATIVRETPNCGTQVEKRWQ